MFPREVPEGSRDTLTIFSCVHVMTQIGQAVEILRHFLQFDLLTLSQTRRLSSKVKGETNVGSCTTLWNRKVMSSNSSNLFLGLGKNWQFFLPNNCYYFKPFTYTNVRWFSFVFLLTFTMLYIRLQLLIFLRRVGPFTLGLINLIRPIQ